MLQSQSIMADVSSFIVLFIFDEITTNIDQSQVRKIKSLHSHTLTETSLYAVLFDKGNVHNKFKILYSITQEREHTTATYAIFL
jgi:hypothetical protein